MKDSNSIHFDCQSIQSYSFYWLSNLITVRLILALVAFQKWRLQQLHVNNTFLRLDLDEEVN